MEKKVIVVLGPTASGKTKLAISLAKKHNTVIINADSRQVYRELKIGTARPDDKEQDGIQHFCLGHVSIHDNYNAGIFADEALQLLTELFKTKDVVVVCGGTGLYINALLNGFDALPETNQQLRQELISLYETKGLKAIQDKLSQIDPEYYAIIDQKNPQRLMRALEICLQTGKTHQELKTNSIKERNFSVEKIGIQMDREKLYERINQRVDIMIESGLVEEAQSLLPFQDLPALKTVGYTELFDYFSGIQTLESAIDKIKQHSRNYAKRQITWFKRDEEINWIKPEQFL